MKTNTTKKLIESSMLIAIATVLSIIQPFQLPFGGGITIASMLPIVLIAYIYGTKHGIFCAFIFSILQMVVGMKTVSAFFLPGDGQMLIWQAILICLIDYILAYSVLGFGGIFKNKMKNHELSFAVGTAFALFLRYIMHIISGAIFFGQWAEWFFTQEGFYKIGQSIMSVFSGFGLSMAYSIFYNGLYMIPEIIITTILAPIILKILISSKTIKLN